MDLGALKRNSSEISSGVWVSDIPQGGDIQVQVRGMTSPIVTTLRGRLERAVPKGDRNRDGSIRTDVQANILRRVLSEAVLLDIKNLSVDGEAVSVEQARELILDPDFEPLADLVMWSANAVDRGVADTIEDVSGN